MESAGASPASRARSALAYVAPKVLQFVFVIWATYTLTFLLIHFLPGDPVLAALSLKGGDATTTDPAALHKLRVQYGLDGSLVEQYVRHLGGVLTGDLGVSISTGQQVSTMIARVLPHSASIAALALVIGIALAVVVTYLAFLTRSTWLRQTLLQIPPLGVAIPAFLTGLVFIGIFSFGLGWFPSSGTRSPLSVWLPSITLALPVGAIFFQVFSAAVFEAAGGAYVFTAVAKGLSPRAIFTRHVLRNSLLASITILGLQIGYLAGGTAVVETVFSRDGIGRMTVNAVLSRDVNVITGVVIVVAVVYSLVNLVVDILYGLIDPRTRPALGRAKALSPTPAPSDPPSTPASADATAERTEA
ncbi:ABC transporter permease [Pseudarthrobacter sp. P1]|uniref:ABC transporter permease n=1 Tax=Pseudarthrobacter sp. P1 TaxID=3418418 RepID=UPI003CF5F6B1